MRTLIRLITISLISIVLLSSFSEPAHALDRRLKLTFKTAAIGAGAGLVIGAGTAALGLGGLNNAFMGASAGMYAGILFAGYLIYTHESPRDRAMQRSRNPYAPRRPVEGEDWKDMDEDEYQNFLPPEQAAPQDEASLESESKVVRLAYEEQTTAISRRNTSVNQSETPLIWSPIVTLEF